MAQIHFRLNTQKKNKRGELPIIMDITFNDQRVKKSTGQRCLNKHWHLKQQRVKQNLSSELNNDYEIINSKLDELDSKARAIINEALYNKKTLDIAYFKSQWEEKNTANKSQKLFVDHMKDFIEAEKPTKADRTIKGHITALNFMKDFSTHYGIKVTLENFDFDLFEKLQLYAFTIKKITDNTFGTIIQRYKTFMNWCARKEYHDNRKYKHFKTPERPVDIICLYEEELFKLYRYDFSNERLERVRDTYCFACFTGLRYSDIVDLSPEHLVYGEIQKIIIKTKEFQKIPLIKYANEILEKYKDFARPIPVISEQKFNEYIKEACEIVGINTPVSITTYRGQEVIRKTLPKYSLITSHTARKTFITNSLIFGVPEMIVRHLSGHKKEANFKKYVNLAESFINEETVSAWDR